MNILRVPIVRQILGACAGAACALLLYEAYALASPPLLTWVQSYGFLPTSSSGAILQEQRDDRLDRLAAQVREKLDR